MFFLFLPQKAAVLVQLEAVALGAVAAGGRARMGQEAEIQCDCGHMLLAQQKLLVLFSWL